jgi:hypothetical protein
MESASLHFSRYTVRFLMRAGFEGLSSWWQQGIGFEEEGCYMGRISDYVATKPWMYGKEDPCAGPGWRERTAWKGENPTPQASAEGTV